MATGANRSSDAWASGTAYEPYVGRWSRLVARDFISWLALPPGGRWLDVGCGTGALTSAILANAAPIRVTGIDPSPQYVGFAQDSVQDSRVEFQVGDALSLPESDPRYDAVVSGLVLNFVPDPDRAVAEMARVVRRGGTAGAYVWDYAGGMQMIRYFWDEAVALDPAAGALDEGVRFPLCRPGPFADLFRNAGLRDVQAQVIDVATVFRDFDDFWTPFLGGQGPAPGYLASVPEDRRRALRDRLRARLPVEADGSIHLVARAWAAKGYRE